MVFHNIRQLSLIILAIPAGSLAYDSDRARNNVAHEFAECGAYYMLVAGAPGLDQVTASKLQKKGEKAAQLSFSLTTPDVAKARHELAIKTMTREMKGSWENLSIVNNKYGYPCIDLMENPEARIQYWLDKKD